MACARCVLVSSVDDGETAPKRLRARRRCAAKSTAIVTGRGFENVSDSDIESGDGDEDEELPESVPESTPSETAGAADNSESSTVEDDSSG